MSSASNCRGGRITTRFCLQFWWRWSKAGGRSWGHWTKLRWWPLVPGCVLPACSRPGAKQEYSEYASLPDDKIVYIQPLELQATNSVVSLAMFVKLEVSTTEACCIFGIRNRTRALNSGDAEGCLLYPLMKSCAPGSTIPMEKFRKTRARPCRSTQMKVPHHGTSTRS